MFGLKETTLVTIGVTIISTVLLALKMIDEETYKWLVGIATGGKGLQGFADRLFKGPKK